MKIFVSYSHPDGLDLANKARVIFGAAGHEPWDWDADKEPGQGVWSQIAERVVNSELIVSVVTNGSATSKGQIREIDLALMHEVPVVTLRVDSAPVPLALTGDTYEAMTEATFEEELAQFEPKLGSLRKSATEAQSAAQRGTDASAVAGSDLLQHLSGLNSRQTDLELDRVTQFLARMESGYLESRSGRLLAKVDSSETDDLDGFVTIGKRSRLSKAEFTDPTHVWSMFARDIGRLVAAGELDYAFKVLSDGAALPEIEVATDLVEITEIEEMIREMSADGFHPDRMIAPNQLLPGLYGSHSSSIEWTDNGEFFLVGGHRLRVIWSSKYFKTVNVYVYDSNATTWHVLPDPLTGKALTHAVGISELYPDQVEFICQSRARFELASPAGIRRLRIT